MRFAYREDIIMIRAITASVALLALGVTAIQLAPQAAGQSGPGWVQLVDGKSMDGWTPTGEANWRVEDGAIVADKGKGGHLVTKDSYKNFMIYSEFWSDEEANSGIFIRCKNPKEIGARTCYEVNIFDKRPDQSYRTGAIVDVAKPLTVINTGGKWNTIDVTARGPRMTVLINGQKMVDVQDNKHQRGPIALQYGAGTVKFKNVKLRTL
jgi:3-keto-disaccharide hydrolase